MTRSAILSRLAALAALAASATCPAAAQDAASAQANNPLANATALNFQNLHTGELTGTDREANQAYLRYAQPFPAFGAKWLMRATLPVVTAPEADGGSTTGLGDFNVFAAWLIDVGDPAVSFGFGPQLTAPTASEDATGSGKWSLGFANVLFDARSKKVQWGYLLTWQASVAGESDRADVNAGALQPFVFWQLGKGWYLRSAGVWTYDFETDGYAMPIGLGAGKVVKSGHTVVNLFLEPQYSLATKGDGQQKWNVFGGVNFQF